MKATIEAAAQHPRVTSIIGSISGWAAVDFLRTAQLAAAILAGLVSLCALILTGPKAYHEIRRWFGK